MAAPTRPPRTRASGGRALMLLGVLLALAAGLIVIFIVSQATSTQTQTVTVVVAQINLPANTILSVSQKDAAHTLISEAFVEKQVSTDFVPKDAYAFTSVDALNIQLNDNVVVGAFYAGEILRTQDPRLAKLGTSAGGSLTNINPAQLKAGDVLQVLNLTGGGSDAKAVAVAGDYIDVLVTLCGDSINGGGSACVSQTTLQNVYVYSVTGTSLVVVLSHQDALTLKFLTETGKVDLVVRKPGDKDPATTTPVSEAGVINEFHFNPGS